jgi:hypothetical protein
VEKGLLYNVGLERGLNGVVCGLCIIAGFDLASMSCVATYLLARYRHRYRYRDIRLFSQMTMS